MSDVFLSQYCIFDKKLNKITEKGTYDSEKWMDGLASLNVKKTNEWRKFGEERLWVYKYSSSGGLRLGVAFGEEKMFAFYWSHKSHNKHHEKKKNKGLNSKKNKPNKGRKKKSGESYSQIKDSQVGDHFEDWFNFVERLASEDTMEDVHTDDVSANTPPVHTRESESGCTAQQLANDLIGSHASLDASSHSSSSFM